MSRRRVVLTLTLAEALELNYLAGDLLSDPEELRVNLGGRRYAVAIRAANKLGKAIADARRTEVSP